MSFPEIVATLGTTTDDAAVIAAMAQEGMSLARINTAYSTGDELARRIELARPTPVLLDLKGPQLRVECTTEKNGALVPCRYPIAKGDLVYVGLRDGPVRFNHDIGADLEAGDEVRFANGTVVMRVEEPLDRGIEPRDGAVLLEVLEPGEGRLNPFTGANVPGKRLSAPPLSARDEAAIEVGVPRGVEWYALSFARDARDVLALHEALAARGDARAGIVPKIEDTSGIERLEEIVRAIRETGRPAAVMIARGDLFVELPFERLAKTQWDLVRRCRELSVPSIVATGLLLTLQKERTPARSEVLDVASAVRDGASSFLLSDETSNGKDPANAVRVLAAIIKETRS
jgi:pyruvate kinase